MVMILLQFVVMFISLAGLIRAFLVLTGLHKGPILAMFERYGGDEPFFYPLPGILFWMGILMVSGGFLLQNWFAIDDTLILMVTFVMLMLAWTAHYVTDHVYQMQDRFPVLPVWYGRLKEETSRKERRRIAYMWLRLPLRTRLLYSANDRAFFLWADLVIAATVREI